jgi:hypothetical protein
MRRQQILLAIWLLGFGFGALTHAFDYVRYGWFPYRFGPPAANLFWNALPFLDALVVVLLLRWRRAGVAAGILLMIADVFVNFWAWRALHIDAFAVSVPLQAAFLLFLLVSARNVTSIRP